MGIGKTNDNYTFYDGYEGEPEIILSLSNTNIIHIWEGYFEDIYGEPCLDGKGWNGFTRDYQQMEGVFSDTGEAEINPAEYLEDLMQYKNKVYDFEETAQVFKLMETLFEKACETNMTIMAKKL